MQELERAAGKRFEEAAHVFYVSDARGFFAPQAMPALYAAATPDISLSRGEGFDLPMVEGGAYLDYLTDRIAHLIPARRVQARLPDDRDMSHLSWPATAERLEGRMFP